MDVKDTLRLCLIVGLGALIGWLAGYPLAGAFLGSLAYIAWLHRHLTDLLLWLRNRKGNDAPEPSGVFESICLEIDYLRERHKKRKKRLGNYLKQFQRATRALPDATVVLDETGAVQWANTAASEQLGIRWPEDMNQRITNLIRLPNLAEHMGTDEQVFQTTLEIASPTSPDRQLSVRLAPFGANQRLFVARDITDLYRLNEIRRDFVANVSHELRTPITVLRGYLENLASQIELAPESWKPAIHQMGDHAERMARLVEELLMLSNLEQEDTLHEKEPVAVSEMLADIHQQACDLGGFDGHMFSLEFDSELLINGSAAELYSCFSNIVFNAVSYTPTKGLIQIRWFRDGDGASFEVKDNGIGIAEEHLARVTERFYRADPSRAREHGGTGLGLAIAKHVLTRHRATITIESELNRGTVVRCFFPRETLAEAPEVPTTPPSTLSA